MNKKVLPITVPPIIGYTVHAYPLAVISHHKECLPWFFSNYIQLVCNTEFNGNFFDFFSLCSILEGSQWIDSISPGIPWINRDKLDGVIFKDYNLNIIDFIITSIVHDNYIVISLDEYFISNKISYKKHHFFHENLIYGYDTQEKLFNVMGFDKSRCFVTSKLSFDELEKSFESNIKHFSYPTINLFKLKQDFKYELDLEHIKELLIEYLYSKNSSNRLRMLNNVTKNCVYGINVYHELEKYYKQLIEGVLYPDIRPAHILWEHKKCMLLRLKFISDYYPEINFDEEYKEYKLIEKKCLLIRNALMKFIVTKESSIIEKIISEMNLVSKKEQELIPIIINKLELHIH